MRFSEISLMRSSNHPEVDVGQQRLADILKNSQCSTHLHNLQVNWSSFGWTFWHWIWVLARPNRPKFGCWLGQTDLNVEISQTKQAKMWLSVRLNRPKCGYWREQIDRKVDNGHADHTKNCYWPNGSYGRNFFQTIVMGRTGPPCPQSKLFWPIPVMGRGPHAGLLYLPKEILQRNPPIWWGHCKFMESTEIFFHTWIGCTDCPRGQSKMAEENSDNILAEVYPTSHSNLFRYSAKPSKCSLK